MAAGATEHSARLKLELTETLNFIAPLSADQASLGASARQAGARRHAREAQRQAPQRYCVGRDRATVRAAGVHALHSASYAFQRLAHHLLQPVAMGNIAAEERSWVYVLRIAAFALILAAIALKNRSGAR